MKIGNINIENNIALGPMAGVTDLPFRSICKEMGCGITYTEMVSAKAILYNNKNTKELMLKNENEHPVGIQLFGSDPDILADIAKRVEDEWDFIDLNMGCPVPKIVNNKEGSALMQEPKLVEQILTKMVKAVKKPVTIKIRKGFTKDNINAVEIGKIAEFSGVSAIAIHGRTREQYYTGKADWDIIKTLKENIKIPVIGNGDVNSPESAKALIDYTNCDAIMVGRGAMGNPWLFKQINEYLNTGQYCGKPDVMQVLEMIEKHTRMLIEVKGELTAIREMRKHVAWYMTGYRFATVMRNEVNKITTLEDFSSLLNRYRHNHLLKGEVYDI